ncbi:MAG: UDP-glucose 4-epimerase GalE, partial [Victivallales bacterium]|nr:UDP-glucose 4-epimerase GalE [Victivallales bacterium]
MREILLTGGTGYIGSHTAVAMIQAGYDIVIVDNLSNSEAAVIDRVEQITGTRPAFYPYDVSDKEKMREVFAQHQISGVIHFAGFKAVNESVQKPLQYYRNNLGTTLTLLDVMAEFGVKQFVFSSSATVYGPDNPCPYKETMAIGGCSSPYGWTKVMNEQMLSDAAAADQELSVVLLRYFNPIGAHESGRIGEAPQGIPNNLMPYVSQVAAGKLNKLTVFGDDYNTPDGTCLRDYIHVMDLAEGHVKAIDFAARRTGVEIFNLGTGVPYSVLDSVDCFQRVNGVNVPHVIGPRRERDLPVSWADAAKARGVLGWVAKRTLEEMCRDA